MRTATLATLAAAFATLFAGESIAADGRFRVLYAEPVVIEGLSARPSRASFDAYGRRFELLLESNARLVASLEPGDRAATAGVKLLRGTVQGVAESWVRLTVDGERQSGMIWDGRDLYVIEPEGDVAPRSVSPMRAGSRKSVVYRLSDTQSDFGAGMCAIVRPDQPFPADQQLQKGSGLDEYRAMVETLQQAAEASGLAGRLQVSALADYEYFQFATSAQAARSRIVEIFNNVDGIFSGQVGIQIDLASVTVFQEPSDPFTGNVARNLLTQLGSYREASPTLRGTGVTHLVTGRDLENSTVGISYIGSLCASRFGVSVSQGVATLTSLVAAHEIGHNFGAPHDGEAAEAGEPVNPCESTPRTFLMAPQLNGNDQFSACSLTQMEPEIQAAACILPVVDGPDVALAAGTGPVNVTIGQVFALGASVTSDGSADATAVQLTFSLPNGLSGIDGSATGGGSCATQAGGIACTWPTLTAGVTSGVSINVRADAAGSYTVPALLTAAADVSSGNDASSFQVTASAPAPPLPPAPMNSGGGGGGSTGGLGLPVLFALLAALRNRLRGAIGADSP